MGYRIDFSVRGGVMQARVSGRSAVRQVAWIAADIREAARRAATQHLLIDMRGLLDRLGLLQPLLLPACDSRRVAIVDDGEHERYYVFAEWIARRRGGELRCFVDPKAALRWLRGRPGA